MAQATLSRLWLCDLEVETSRGSERGRSPPVAEGTPGLRSSRPCCAACLPLPERLSPATCVVLPITGGAEQGCPTSLYTAEVS